MNDNDSNPRLVISTCGPNLLGKATSRKFKDMSQTDKITALDNFIAKDPTDGHTNICPEVQSILTLESEKKIDRNRDYFTFIVTGPDVALALSRIVRILNIDDRLYKERHASEIQGLDDIDEFRPGAWDDYCVYLLHLTSVASKNGYIPLINATAGFRAFLSYASWVGYFTETNVYYQFENHHKIHEIPPFPKTPGEGFYKEFAAFIEYHRNRELRDLPKTTKYLEKMFNPRISEN